MKIIHVSYARQLCRLALIVCTIVTFGAAPGPRSSPVGVDAAVEQYRQKIPQIMADSRIPGLSVALVDTNGVLWQQGFGQTDWPNGKAVTPDTAFSIQSMSKTFTALAVMMAVQDGLVDLDEPITTYLPDFTVHSIFEDHPERKMTLRRLLSHTSGLGFDAPVGNNDDWPGAGYDAHIRSISDTWLKMPVGKDYSYSNMGIDLAAYIVQVVSGKPFPEYARAKVFAPLGMTHSTYDVARITADPDRAIGHAAGFDRLPVEVPMMGAGGLYTSAADLGRFLQFMLNHGKVNGTQVLRENLVDEMMTVPFDVHNTRYGDPYALGVSWYLDTAHQVWYPNHGGGGFGFATFMAWYPDLGLGAVVLTNSSAHDWAARLPLDIAAAVIDNPDTIYHARLQSASHIPWQVQRGRYSPVSTTATVMDKALPVTDEARQRWATYEGWYAETAWGIDGNVYHFYLQVGLPWITQQGSGQMNEQVYEVQPGLFFDASGNTYDLRGPVLRVRNYAVHAVSPRLGPWQVAILAACGLLFLLALVGWPIYALVQRRKGRVPLLPGLLGMAAGVVGIAGLALLYLAPALAYTGPLGGRQVMPLWQQVVLLMPLLTVVLAVLLLAVAAWSWLRRSGPCGARVFLTLVTVAAMVCSAFWLAWGWL
jgi:CubicO group peptidase (beta-lactamase class C family)